MLKKILLVLAVAVGALAAVVATRPDTYHVERSTTIQAPPEVVFSSVGDMAEWSKWSPWEKRDPAMKKTYSTATSGVGATYAWEGNKEVGKGKMTITESTPPTKVAQRLEFLEPFASVAETSVALKAEGTDGTRVTWAMDGKNNFVSKAFSLAMNMDKMIGKDFDEGLSNLKKISEEKAAKAKAEAAAKAAADAEAKAKAAAEEQAAAAAPASKKKKKK
jgi:hypothetical protein